MESATLLKRATCNVALVALLLASPALVSATPLPIDSGTALFNGPSFVPGLTLNGYVEYAVWAPNTFPSYGNADISVSPGDQTNDYVYTYQVFNNPATGPAGYTQIPAVQASEVSYLNVAVNVPVTNIGEYVPPAGISPTFDTVGQAAQWAFFSVDIEPGQNSVGLFFTSPFSYTNAASSVQDGIAANITLPTPVPEPGSFVLLGLGTLAGVPWLVRRHRRRQ